MPAIGIRGLSETRTYSHSDSGFRFRLHGPSFGFAAQTEPLLAPYDLSVAGGEWIALLGPSGIGKSSLLRAMAGLLPGHKGSGNLADIAWMAQSDLLLPWLSLLDNVLLGARLRGEKPDRASALMLLERCGLLAAKDMLPAQLSGGMRQRAALARTFMENRPLVLMDEPFTALDPVRRGDLHALAADLLRDRAVIFVTHDPLEALALADRIYVLADRPARLDLLASPQGARPRDPLDAAWLPDLRYIQGRIQAALRQAAKP